MIVFGTTVEIANSDDRADPQDRDRRPSGPRAGARRPAADATRGWRQGKCPTPSGTERETVSHDVRDPRFYKFLKLTSKMPSAVRAPTTNGRDRIARIRSGDCCNLSHTVKQ